MPNLITLKVDVRKLDKARFFEGKPDKDGHRPLYADLVLIARKEPGKFGDTHVVKQSKKKDENVELPIIGSATERGGYSAPQQSETETRTFMNAPASRPAPVNESATEDVPF